MALAVSFPFRIVPNSLICDLVQRLRACHDLEEVSRELGVDLYCISHALWGGALMKYE